MRSVARRLLLVWLAALALATTTPAATAADIAIRDDRGATLSFTSPPRRIVSLLPSFTESVCALGACD